MVIHFSYSQQTKKNKECTANNTQGTHVTDITANPAYQVARGNQEEETDYVTVNDW